MAAFLDDEFWDHPKFVALLEHEHGLTAIGLWSMTLGWAKKQATRPERATYPEGFVPIGLVRRLGGTPELTALLESAPPGYEHGLWERGAGGWHIHDFAHWQQIEQWRARIATAKRGARARWQPDGPTLFDAPADAQAHAQADAQAHAQAHALADAKSNAPSNALTTNHITTTSKSKPLLSADAAERFDEFWREYPRRVGKGQAIKAFARAMTIADAATIIAGARSYAALRAGQDPKYTRHASTWLNGQCWTDEPDQDPGSVSAWEPN